MRTIKSVTCHSSNCGEVVTHSSPSHSPVPLSLAKGLFPSDWRIAESHLRVWLGGLTIRYKSAWPYQKPPQLHLQLAQSPLHVLFETLGIEPNILQITRPSQLKNTLSRIAARQPSSNVLLHVSNHSESSWQRLRQTGSHWAICGGHTKDLQSLECLVSASDTLQLVWFPMSAFNGVSSVEFMRTALQRQAAHLLDPMGPMHHIKQWQIALKRPSLRLSWPKILRSPVDYFWVMLQLGAQLRGDSSTVRFDGQRLSIAESLVNAAELLNRPSLSRLALDLRRSGQCWQIIQEIMLLGPSTALKTARNLLSDGADLNEPIFRTLAEQFGKEGGIHDLPFRLRAIHRQLNQILEIEMAVGQKLTEAFKEGDTTRLEAAHCRDSGHPSSRFAF